MFDQALFVLDSKYAAESLFYAIDVSGLLLPTGDSVVSSSLVLEQQALEPNDLVITVLSGTTDVPFIFQLSAGTSGITYTIQFTLTTLQGYIWNRQIFLPVL